MGAVVLTGAGISRSAGLATYRGEGGLWSDPEIEKLSHAEALRTRRADACQLFWAMRRAVQRCMPTPAHRALAAFEQRGRDVLVVTQNVDGLHQAAGSKRVVEYHGSLARWRCECGHVVEPPDAEHPPIHCDLPMRPDVVLFGEDIPAAADHAVTRALRDCELFVAIGTSGTVWPASSFVRSARYSGARTVLLDLEPMPEARELFDEVHSGQADDLVPRHFAAL
jgi:NAD-dependent deacetylase